MPDRKIKVLIVDDSLIFRRAVEKSLEDEENIIISGSVHNGQRAVEFIKASPPDIVTLDVEMPEMDGMQALREIQSFNEKNKGKIPPIGVIMLSALTKKGAETTMNALQAGAFDFIPKPVTGTPDENIDALKRQLITKINVWGAVQNSGRLKASSSSFSRPPPGKNDNADRASRIEAVVIGVSTGGPKALNEMMPDLCARVKLPILIVQHMPPTFTKSLAEQLNGRSSHCVTEASDGDIVKDAHAYIAPGGKHMTVKKLQSSGNVQISINDQPPENGCKPSVDVLFRSAANCYNGNVLAMILTGMGNDGTKGIAPLKRAGAYVIVQDEASSVVWGMPGSAAATGNVDDVVPLMDIPQAAEKIIYRK